MEGLSPWMRAGGGRRRCSRCWGPRRCFGWSPSSSSRWRSSGPTASARTRASPRSPSTARSANYAHAIRPLYLGIILKSFWFAASPRRSAWSSASRWRSPSPSPREKTKVWLLLLIMLPFWTNLLIRTYALMAVLRDEGYINTGPGLRAGAALSHVGRARRPPAGAVPAAADCCTTTSRWCSASSMSSCRSWSCRSTRPSTGSTARCWRRASTWAPGT